MTVEIRTLTHDELEAAVTMSIRAFAGAGADVSKDLERQPLSLYPPDWHLGAFEGGEIAAMMRVLPYAMHLNEGTIPAGIVSPVASSPLYRRRGHAGAMLRHSLAQMRKRGQWLSALYTPHPALYRRYGWEIAADERSYEFKPKDLRLTASPTERGRLRALKPDDWQQLASIYDTYAAGRNGPLVRDELWWRNWVVETWAGKVEALLWETDGGVPKGYMLYVDPAQPPNRNAGKFVATELISLSGDAYLNLIDCIAQQDIREDAVYYAASDDPLPLLFADAERLTIRQSYTVFLRVVDVAEALKARVPADPSLSAEFTLEVKDRAAPWNEATWRVCMTKGVTEVEAIDGPGDLRLDVGALAPLFNGYLSPSRASAAGLVRASRMEALTQANAFFAVQHRPYFTDRF